MSMTHRVRAFAARRGPAKTRVLGRAVVGGLAAVAVVAGPVVASGGTAYAAASTSAPTVTFATPSVSGFSATLSYTVNRAPQQIASVTCSLTVKGGPTSSASCGHQTGSSSKGTGYAVTLTGLNAGLYTYGAIVKLTDGGGAAGNASFTVKTVPASCTVTAYSTTYDGGSHSATGTCIGIGGVNLSADLNVASTTHSNAGSYPSDKWSFSDPSGNYTNPGGTVSDLIGKATPSCTVTAYSTTYDGVPHSAIGTCTGAGGTNLSSGLNLSGTTHTNVGSYMSDHWSFTDSLGNYNNAAGTIGDSIGQATASCTVTAYSATYDGNVHTATGSCTGAGGANLDGDLNLTGTTHTDAGSYPTDTWSFTDPSGNYKTVSETVDDTIGDATAYCTVSPYSATYNGSSHTATGSCAGINGVALPSSDLDLGNTTHTNAGSYTDAWSFSDPNYSNPGGTITDTIGEASATCTVTSYSLTFDGNPHGATGSCSGINGAALPSSDLDLGNTTHTNAGAYTDAWSFSDPNYSNPGGTITDTIGKAAADCAVTGYSTTYDGNIHSANGSCTGINGVSLPADELDLSFTAHIDAGGYSDPWSFSDPDGNYDSSSGHVSDLINKEAVSCTVTAYTTTFDGSPHTATGTCTGIGGVDLSAHLDLTGTTHTNAGTYSSDSWAFSDLSGDFLLSQATSVSDVISQASASCTVSSYSVTFDGSPHIATGTCTGIGGVDLSADLSLAGTSHTDAGSYSSDAWSFNDPAGNYANPGGTVTDDIGQASADCTVTGYDVNYDQQWHTATGSCTGVGDVTLPAADLSLGQTTHLVVGVYSSDAWSFSDASGNYASSSGTVTDQITTTVVCTVTGYTVTYDGNAHTATGSCSDGTKDLSSMLQLNLTVHTDAGTFTDTWTFHDPTDTYPDQSGTTGDTIRKADAACSVTGYDKPFNGGPIEATGSCTGVGGVSLNRGLDLTGTLHTNVGTYIDSWSFNTNNTYPDYNQIVEEYVSDTITNAVGTGGCETGCVA